MPISLKNSNSILPYVRYSPQSNSMTVAGEDNKPREISFLGKSFATEIENGSMGWLLIAEGARDWKPFAIDSVPPPSPGQNYKRGFSILLYAPKLLGSPEAHEMCSSTGAHLSFCERLFNEAEPHFGKGDVPIVKITEAEPIKVGKGKSRELKFEIVKWVPRPAAIVEALAKLPTPHRIRVRTQATLQIAATISMTKTSRPRPKKKSRRRRRRSAAERRRNPNSRIRPTSSTILFRSAEVHERGRSSLDR
jgi:hypothetical protein